MSSTPGCMHKVVGKICNEKILAAPSECECRNKHKVLGKMK